MTNPVAEVRQVQDGERLYTALAFVCPGCALDGQTGLHMLPVAGGVPDGRARWDWDGSLVAPTLSPSILTQSEHRRARGANGELFDAGRFVCHSFLRAGVFEYLGDCTHSMAGQRVPMVPLQDWMVTRDA